MIKRQRFALLALIMLLITACNNNVATTPVPREEASPVATTSGTTPAAAYPLPEVAPQLETGYPSTNSGATLLAFDKPIQPDDTVVTGVGPAGLTVYILNITFMGAELGSGVIGNDGTFAIQVGELQRGTRIGLTADITTIGLTEADIQPGNEEMAMPRVGYFFDTFVLPQP